MPTRFYLSTATATYTPATMKGAWDDTAGAVTRQIKTYKDDGGAITTVIRAETNASSTYDVLLYRGVSNPLQALAMIGNVNVVLGVLESDVAADMYFHVHAYITIGDSDSVRDTLVNDYVENTTNEFGTVIATCGLAFQSSQVCLGGIVAGDRIVVEIGYISREAAATNRTGTLYYGTQNATTLDFDTDLSVGGNPTLAAGYVEFSDTIIEDVSGIEIRETQALTKVMLVNEPAIRETQVLAKALVANDEPLRVTQVLVKVLHSTESVVFKPFWALQKTRIIGGGID